MRTTCDHTCIKVVVQSIEIGINKCSRSTLSTRCDVVLGRLSFYIIGNTIAVAVEVVMVKDSITIGIPT